VEAVAGAQPNEEKKLRKRVDGSSEKGYIYRDYAACQSAMHNQPHLKTADLFAMFGYSRKAIDSDGSIVF